MEITIQGKQYPLEFGMQALMATCKEIGAGVVGVEELMFQLQTNPMETCQILIKHCLKNTARKYRQPFALTDDDLWLLFDDPEFVLVNMPKVAEDLIESVKVGEQAQALLGSDDSKKKEETVNQ